MRIKDYTDMVGHLTDSFNIPEARRMIAENPALTQEQFTANRLKWMEEPLEPAPWDKPETPWSEEPKEPYPWEAKEGGGSQLVQPGPGRPGYKGEPWLIKQKQQAKNIKNQKATWDKIGDAMWKANETGDFEYLMNSEKLQKDIKQYDPTRKKPIKYKKGIEKKPKCKPNWATISIAVY